MNFEKVNLELPDGEILENIVIDLGDGSFKSFPADPANPEYVAFLESLNDNTETE